MKVSIALVLASAATTSAFSTPSRPAFVSRSGCTQLFEKVDSSEAVKAALAASEEFGSTSAEARAAWDIVEELDASNSHQAAATATAEPKAEAVSTGDADFTIKTAAEALENAKKITEEKGITSPDARIAWELVEELAATETHHKEVGSG